VSMSIKKLFEGHMPSLTLTSLVVGLVGCTLGVVSFLSGMIKASAVGRRSASLVHVCKAAERSTRIKGLCMLYVW